MPKKETPPGEVTMSALDLMRAADALTGVKPGRPPQEISRLQDLTREELEERYETQQEERNGPSNEAGRVPDPRSRGEGVRRTQADRLKVGEGARLARDQAGRSAKPSP